MTDRARRRSHPLLRPFPLAVMVLTTFLIVFVLMMARMRQQTALLPLASSHALVQRTGSGTTIRTTASGRAIATGATPASAGGSQQTTAPAVVTSASGAAGARDD